MIERIATAMYDDNLRQLNAIAADHAQRQGYEPMVTTHVPFAEADQHVRIVYRSYAGAALDALAEPSARMIYAAAPETLRTLHPRDVFKAMIAAAKEGK